MQSQKWKSRKGTKPVPWPNTFWLVCPKTAGIVGQLEHQGLIQKYHAMFVSPEVAATRKKNEKKTGGDEGDEGDDDEENNNNRDEEGAAVNARDATRQGSDSGASSSSSSSSYSPKDAATFARQHEAYARYRWSLLTPEDAEYATREGYKSVLADCGVGGLRFTNQVKCLHLHYAHYLASGGDNLVGSWVQAEIDRRHGDSDSR